ncbi:MAG: hypothetical protein R2860_06195 [Desulfobacterales bacterium]
MNTANSRTPVLLRFRMTVCQWWILSLCEEALEYASGVGLKVISQRRSNAFCG